jgi:hypothetical protein
LLEERERKIGELLGGHQARAVCVEILSYWVLKVMEVRSPGLIAAWLRRCSEGEELCRQLLAKSPRARREVAAAPAVTEWLLDKSRALQVDQPAAAGELARLGVRLADEMPGGAAYSARGLCLLANARRLQGQWRAAARHLRAASLLLTHATPLDRTFYLRCLGLLRWDKRESTEAFALLEHARTTFERQGALDESGATAAILGTLRVSEGESVHEAELQSLFDAILRLDWETQSAIGTRAALALASILADKGERELAQQILKRVGRSPRGTSLCGWERWFEARARERVGEWQRSIELFEQSREIFFGGQRLYETGAVSWELAAALSRNGAHERVREIAEDIASFCPQARAKVQSAFAELLGSAAGVEREAVEKTGRWLRCVLEGEGHRRAPLQFG